MSVCSEKCTTQWKEYLVHAITAICSFYFPVTKMIYIQVEEHEFILPDMFMGYES
jgi:hypothetical protein